MFDSNEVAIRPENRTDVFICSPARKTTGIAKQPCACRCTNTFTQKWRGKKQMKMNRETKRTHAHNFPLIPFISSSSFPHNIAIKSKQIKQKTSSLSVCLSICQPWPLWAGRQGKPSIWRLDKKHWVFGRILLSRSTDPIQALRHRASITFCQLRATSFEPESNNILHWRNKTSNEGLVQSKSTVITDVCTVCTWLARVIASLWLSIVLVMVHIHSKDRCASVSTFFTWLRWLRIWFDVRVLVWRGAICALQGMQMWHCDS